MNSYVLIFLVFFPMIMGLINYFISKKQPRYREIIAILTSVIELGFMTNSSELAKLTNTTYQKKAANAIFDTVTEIFKVAHSTIQNYLSKGNEIGWCNYNGKSYKVLAGMKSGRAKGKPIVVFLNGEKIKEYPSASELERNSEKDFGVKLLATSASAVARGEHKHHKGYTFSYKNTEPTQATPQTNNHTKSPL